MNNTAVQPGMRNKWFILMIMAFNGILVILDMSIANISYPSLTRTFDTSATTVLWVSVAYSLISASMMPIWGKLGDIYGRKRLLLIGFSIFTAGLILCSISQTIIQLIIFRAFQAIGGSVYTALSMAIIASTFPGKERGQALGIMTAVVTAGPLIGPTLGGFLLDALDWRALFYVRVPFSIIGIILIALFLREQKTDLIKGKVDYWGAAFLFTALAGLTLFLNQGGSLGFNSLPVLVLAGAAIVFMTLFIFRERRCASPLIKLSIFNNRVFTAGQITIFIQNFAFATIMLLVPFLLIDGLGYSSSASGLLLSVTPLVMLLSPVSGWLADRIGAKPLILMGIIVCTLGLFLCSRLNVNSRSIDVVLSLAVMGLGNTLFMSPSTVMILGSITKDNLGTTASLLSTVRTIGMSSGMALAGTIYASRQLWHSAQLTLENPGASNLEQLSLIAGYRDATLIMTFICALGIISALVCLRNSRTQPKATW
jgi:EmrB/QacA subfamily drug resistance transporter